MAFATRRGHVRHHVADCEWLRQQRMNARRMGRGVSPILEIPESDPRPLCRVCENNGRPRPRGESTIGEQIAEWFGSPEGRAFVKGLG